MKQFFQNNSILSGQKTKWYPQTFSQKTHVDTIEKPIHLLFSVDQFVFEFSKQFSGQKKTRDYFQQLKSRKKYALFYGDCTVHAKAFSRIEKYKGFFSEKIFLLYEQRLDVVLYRSGLSKTIKAARQMILHKKVQVNQCIVSIPSFRCSAGDFIAIHTNTLMKRQGYNTFFRNISAMYKGVNGHEKTQFFCDSEKSIFYQTPLQLMQHYRNRKICLFLIGFLLKQSLQKKQGFFLRVQHHPDWTISHQNVAFTFCKSFLYDNAESVSRTIKKQFHPKTSNKPKQLQSLDMKKRNLMTVTQLNKRLLWSWCPVFWSYSMYSIVALSTMSTNIIKNHNKGPKKQAREDRTRFLGVRQYPSFFSLKKKSPSLNLQPVLTLYKKCLDSDHIFKSKIGLYTKAVYSAAFYNASKSLPTRLEKTMFFHKQAIEKNGLEKNNVFFSVLSLPVYQCKPIHLEVSYNLQNIIYLYPPQRIWFPFFIDIESICKSF